MFQDSKYLEIFGTKGVENHLFKLLQEQSVCHDSGDILPHWSLGLRDGLYILDFENQCTPAKS